MKQLPGFAEGLFTNQDITASQAVRALKPEPHWAILDFCAAPGTKTTQLAEMTGDKARILATDIDLVRLEKIKENVTYTAKGYASWGSMVDTEGNLLSDPDDPILYDIARAQSIIGTPEECIETIKQYQNELPIDNLICRFKFPGISHEEAMRSMKLFAEKVLPDVS